MANANRGDRARLSPAADAALEELFENLRSDVIVEASRRAPDELLSAADVVRAYYRVASPPETQESAYRYFQRITMRNVAFLAFGATIMAVATAGSISAAFLFVGTSIVPVAWSAAALFLVGGIGYVVLLVARLRERARSREIRDWASAPERLTDTHPTTNYDVLLSGRLAREGSEVNDVSRVIFLNRWLAIESKVDQLYQDTVAPELQSARRPFGAKVAELRLSGMLRPEVNGKLVELLKVRNDTVHGRETTSYYPSMLADIDFVNRELDSMIADKRDTA